MTVSDSLFHIRLILNYKIENRRLTILGAGISKEYMLIKADDKQMQFEDLKEPTVQIIWTRK